MRHASDGFALRHIDFTIGSGTCRHVEALGSMRRVYARGYAVHTRRELLRIVICQSMIEMHEACNSRDCWVGQYMVVQVVGDVIDGRHSTA